MFPVEFVGIFPLTAVVFFVGERSFRRVPYPKTFTALVSVQIVNRHNAVLFIGGRCKKGINERPGTNNYRSATRSRNNATPPYILSFILTNRYNDVNRRVFCLTITFFFRGNRFRFLKFKFHVFGRFAGNGGFLFNRPQFDFGGRREFAFHRRVAFVLPFLNGFPVHRHIERGSIVADGGVGIIRVRQGHLVIASFQEPGTRCQIQLAVGLRSILLTKFLVGNGDAACVVGFHAEIIQAVFLDLDEHFRRSRASGVLARRTVKVERHRVNSEFLRDESLLPVADKLRADRLVQWYIIIHVPELFLVHRTNHLVL